MILWLMTIGLVLVLLGLNLHIHGRLIAHGEAGAKTGLEGMVGYSLYDALRDVGSERTPVCTLASQERCGPRYGRPGDGRRCYALAMSACMAP